MRFRHHLALVITAAAALTLTLSACDTSGNGENVIDDPIVTDSQTPEPDKTDPEDVEPVDDETSEPSGPQEIAYTSIQVGDCIATAGSGTVKTLPRVDCSLPHEEEVYARDTSQLSAALMMNTSDQSTDEIVSEIANKVCSEAFAEYTGSDLSTTTLSASAYTPDKATLLNARQPILCVVSDPAGSSTGSLQASGR